MITMWWGFVVSLALAEPGAEAAEEPLDETAVEPVVAPDDEATRPPVRVYITHAPRRTVCGAPPEKVVWREPPGALWYERYEASVLDKMAGLRSPNPGIIADQGLRGGLTRGAAAPRFPEVAVVPTFALPRPMPTRMDRILW